MLLDSNIVIYSLRPEYADLRRFVLDTDAAVSAITFVEVLGYHRLEAYERAELEEFFARSVVFPLMPNILDRAIHLRQARKMDLGDSLVAATALVHKRTLVTRNVKDFAWIDGLTLHNPFPPE